MQVLVSVNSVPETQVALSADVRLIDLKETSHGALAALDPELSRAIIDEVNTYRHQHPAADITVSATIGDDCASDLILAGLIQARLDIGVDVIKLPETIWANPDYQNVIGKFLSRKVRLIAVLPPVSLTEKNKVETTLQYLVQSGYWGVMVDTLQKSQPLTALMRSDQLAFFVRSAKSANLYVGLAGGLSLEQFDQLADLQPDYLGFRSGLCANQRREQSLIPEKVQQLTSKLYQIC
jgi:uncharacterized protein (UPF0264 family)